MQKTYQVVSSSGLNAKAASVMVGVFNKFNGTIIRVFHNDEIADGKSILSLITLMVKYHELIIIDVEGPRVEELFELFNKTINNTSPKMLEEI